MTGRARDRATGVTLVELMVVVVIVAIVAVLAARATTGGNRAGGIARELLMTTINARRDALAAGAMAYPQSSPYAGTTRAPCMPNAQVIITPTEVRQHVCATLLDTVPPNALPCTTVANDCTWSGAVRSVAVPGDVVIAYVEMQDQDTGARTKVALSDEARIWYRPDGSTDACVDCGTDPNLGAPNETLTVFLRPVTASDADCVAETGRCFKVLPQARQTTRW